jgi:hypothetical protein
MPTLNGKPFPVYPIDTQETLKNRAALMVGTLPNFLATIPEDLTNLEEKQDIQTTNLFDLINLEDGSTLDELFGTVVTKYKASKESVVYTWLHKQPEGMKGVYITIFSTLELLEGVNIQRIMDSETNDQGPILKKFLKEQVQVEAKFAEFATVIPVSMDKITIQKITFEATLIISQDLVELFDRLKMSVLVPYANNGSDRHKIFKSFKFLGENWELSDPSAIYFHVLNTKDIPAKIEEKNYSEAIITIRENKTILSVETILGSSYTVLELINRILDSFQLEQSALNSDSIREDSINSIVNIPQQRFNRFILADLLATDIQIQTMCYTDESSKIGRVRAGITFFYHPIKSEQKVTISCTEVPVELKDFRENRELYPLGTNYVRVRIKKARNKEITGQVADFIGKIFSTYNRDKKKISSIYESLIGSGFKEEAELKVKTRIRKVDVLTNIDPIIFPKGYPRLCQQPPVIVDDLVVKSAIKDQYFIENIGHGYKSAILFPRNGATGTQHWYACNYQPNFNHPGLKENTSLINSSDFPYLPCCFKEFQLDQDYLKDYYAGVVRSQSSKRGFHIQKTLKLLKKGYLGYLPPELDKFFKIIFGVDTEILRSGTDGINDSFFKAVELAMGKDLVLNKLQLSVCRQNAYFLSVDELKRIIEKNEYINPRLFYRCLEEYYKCRIYIFTIVDEICSFVYPDHKYAYLRYIQDDVPAVVIFEHYGSERDAVQIPRSEYLIVKSIGKNVSKFTGSPVAKLDKLFLSTIKYYSEYRHIVDIQYPKNLNIISQGIDSFGKTRFLVVNYNKVRFYIITDPLPPLNVPEEMEQCGNNSEYKIKLFIKEYKINNVTKLSDRYTGIQEGTNLKFIFPFNLTGQSHLREYNNNQRIARYLQEYSYYIFSKYIYENKLPLDPNGINKFLRDYTVVVQNYKYPKIPRKFDTKGAYFQQGGAQSVGPLAGYFQQGAQSLAIGNTAGQVMQSAESVCIGNFAGNYYQGTQSIAIGYQAAQESQGESSIAIGYQAGCNSQ